MLGARSSFVITVAIHITYVTYGGSTMARYWAISALAFLAMASGFTQAGADKDKDFRTQGKLTKNDPKDPQRGGPSHTHAVKMKAGKSYTIDMVSKELDSYLRLLDPKGTPLAEDDDSGGDLNAHILFNCTKDGEYKIACTSFGPNAMGSYTLTVKTAGAAQPTSTAHARMVNKAAPEFRSDFAVNGKSVALADLKGKIVLLDFCDVRSSSCVAQLARLREWDKTYKSKGLVIVGITFYPSDIDQALGFDAEAGTIKTVKTADRKSDRALFGAFAEYHKVTHLLTALSKQDALAAFDAYAVNGVPQLVLIDRQGIVRLVDVGSEKSRANVEAEIKKLLGVK
jgi:peroxiredoxin